MTRLPVFINGERCESEGGRFCDAFDPSSMRVIAQVPEGPRADADRAVRAAHLAEPDRFRSLTIEHCRLAATRLTPEVVA